MTPDQKGAVVGGIIGTVVFAAVLAIAPPLGALALFEFAVYSLALGFAASQVTSHALAPSPETQSHCFPAGTPILLGDGTTKPIEDIAPRDLVLAFDKSGELVPRRVVRLFRNVTEQWVELSFDGNDREPLIVTPGHSFLTVDGTFETIERILQGLRGLVWVNSRHFRASAACR